VGSAGVCRKGLGQYAVDTVRRGGQNENGMAYWAGFNARLLVDRGDLAGARAALRRSDRAMPGSDGDLLLRRAEVEVLLGEAAWDRALEAVYRLDGAATPGGEPGLGSVFGLRGRVLAGLRRFSEAPAASSAGVEAARRWGAPSTVGSALRVLAGVPDATGSDSCVSVFEEAVSLLSASPARLELARAEFGLGGSLRRRGQVVAARPHQARAIELTTVGGADGLAGLANAELRVAGGRPRQRAVSGINALTPSERRAVELAAAGRTNRAIAQELYVTPKKGVGSPLQRLPQAWHHVPGRAGGTVAAGFAQ
jgi:hypothetical protein